MDLGSSKSQEGKTSVQCSSVEWVNHASFVLRCGSVSLLIDPWLEGRVFLQGWELLSPTRFRYEDFASISHIWFSHQHPDHFSPPNLKKIPPEVRASITILYQQTNDRTVVKYCQTLGFGAVLELPTAQHIALSDDLSVCCIPCGGGDSLLAIRTPDSTILNLNDCLMDETEAREIRSVVGSPTVLLTQFSYAQWEGNEDDRARRESAARLKLEQIELRLRVFEPQWIIPCASFVWFCHDQNVHMNDAINTIGRVASWLSRYPVHTLVLYPGDVWEIGAPRDNAPALTAYAKDYAAIPTRTDLTRLQSAERDRLELAASGFRSKVRDKIGLLEYLLERSLHIFVIDLNRSASFSILHGLRWTTGARSTSDVALSSDALLYGFELPWGFNAVEVSGRLWIRDQNAHRKFRLYSEVAIMLGQHSVYYKSLLGRAHYLVRRLRASESPLRMAWQIIKRRGVRQKFSWS